MEQYESIPKQEEKKAQYISDYECNKKAQCLIKDNYIPEAGMERRRVEVVDECSFGVDGRYVLSIVLLENEEQFLMSGFDALVFFTDCDLKGINP